MSTYEKILKHINDNNKHNKIDHYWTVRKYLEKYNNHKLSQIANYPFEYMQKIDHPSISQLCTNSKLKNDTEYEDKTVTDMSQKFNTLVKSSRTLYKCYDCGTSARALFFTLAKKNRGNKLNLTNEEKEHISNMYKPGKFPNHIFLKKWKDTLCSINEGVVICSIGFGEFGHVFCIEKTIYNNKPIYQLFQSCFHGYLLIDYLAHIKYAENRYKTINIDELYTDLLYILRPHEWTNKTYDIFWKWFCFKKRVSKKQYNSTKFCFACIKYT